MITIVKTPVGVKATSPKPKKRKPIKQFTNKGLTIAQLVDTAKEGDQLKLVADYTFGMRHDKWKTATLKDHIYIYVKGSREYTPNSSFAVIKSIDGTPYSMLCDDESIIGLEIVKK